jgi:hypothetical protein
VDSENAFRWVLDYNLKNLVSFYNYMRSLLREKRVSEEVNNNPAAQKTIEYYDNINTANFLLLSISFLEEMLIQLWRRQLPNARMPKGSSILRYIPVMDNLGLELGKMHCWSVVTDAYLIRNCLLHTNGKIYLIGNQKDIRSCINRHNDVLDEHLEVIVVTPLLLERSINAIQELKEKLLLAQQAR